jgi:hypothetical protein
MTVAVGLGAAFMLARGRPEGLKLLAADEGSVARSFWAAAIALPMFIALQVIGGGWADVHALALDLAGFVIGWAGFALLARPLVAIIGRPTAWPRYIVAWNWCNVVQYVLMLTALLLGQLSGINWLAEALWIVAICWSLWVEWFAAKLTLEVPGVAAAAVVVVDLVLGLVVGALTSGGA